MTNTTEVAYMVAQNGGPLVPAYALLAAEDGGDDTPLALIPRDDGGAGAITAVDQAARLSLRGGPVEVYLPSGHLLARFVGGAREGRTRPLRAPVKAVD
jgi:hypothetical protein